MFFLVAPLGSEPFDSLLNVFLTVFHLAQIWWESREADPMSFIEDLSSHERNRGILDSGAQMAQAVWKELEDSKLSLNVIERFCNFKQNDI